jgi:hypothetical protein
MVYLPHRERAVLDLRKIEDYCLNPQHPRGRHKARLFLEALGIQRTDAPWLRECCERFCLRQRAIAKRSNLRPMPWETAGVST